MPEVVVVRGESGAIFEMDVPTAGHALERWNEKLTKGELTVISEPTVWVVDADGTRRLVLAEVDEQPVAVVVEQVEPETPRRRGRPPKSAAAVEVEPSAPEADDTETE